MGGGVQPSAPGRFEDTVAQMQTHTNSRGEAQGYKYTQSTERSAVSPHPTPGSHLQQRGQRWTLYYRGQRAKLPPLSHTSALTATGVVASRHAITRLGICSL